MRATVGVPMAADSTPLIRASYAKTVVGGIKRRPAAEQAMLLSRIGDDLRAEIRAYGMLDWMPAVRFAALVDTVTDALGPQGAKDFWKANLLLSLERRLLSPLRLGAIAVYGNSPRSLLKMTPQAWELVSKNCGVCQTIDRPPSGIVLRFDQLPPELCSPGLLALWSGGSESCIARMDFEGGALAQRIKPGTVEVRVQWTTK